MIITEKNRKSFNEVARKLEQIIPRMLVSVWPEVVVKFQNLRVEWWYVDHEWPSVRVQLRRKDKVLTISKYIDSLFMADHEFSDEYIEALGHSMIRAMVLELINLGLEKSG